MPTASAHLQLARHQSSGPESWSPMDSELIGNSNCNAKAAVDATPPSRVDSRAPTWCSPAATNAFASHVPGLIVSPLTIAPSDGDLVHRFHETNQTRRIHFAWP